MNKVNAYTYYYEGEYGECTVFLNSDKIPVDIVFGNDGEWRTEYFNPALERCGIVVEQIEPSDEILQSIENFVESVG